MALIPKCIFHCLRTMPFKLQSLAPNLRKVPSNPWNRAATWLLFGLITVTLVLTGLLGSMDIEDLNGLRFSNKYFQCISIFSGGSLKYPIWPRPNDALPWFYPSNLNISDELPHTGTWKYVFQWICNKIIDKENKLLSPIFQITHP